jgi:hypothetical protein
VQDTLGETVGAIECEGRNVEVQWNDTQKCVLGTMNDLVGKVERIARKPRITQEMVSKMDERRNWTNVKNEEGRKIRKTEERIEKSHTKKGQKVTS